MPSDPRLRNDLVAPVCSASHLTETWFKPSSPPPPSSKILLFFVKRSAVFLFFLETAQECIDCSHCCRWIFQANMGCKRKELKNTAGLIAAVESSSSGGFRGGDGGDASPPTSLKVTILAEKSASVSNKSAPFRDASPPTDLFFFFFFWRPPEFGRKKRLNFRLRPKN